MFNLIVSGSNTTDLDCYTFSDIEFCIDFINISKSKAIKDKIYDIHFSLSRCIINDINIQNQLTLSYSIDNNKIYINTRDNVVLGLMLTDDLTVEILYKLCEKNDFIISDDVIW